MAFYVARPLVRISRAAYCISTSYLYTCRVRNKLKDGNSTVKMVRHRRRRNVNAGEFQLRWEKLLLLSYSTTADSFEVKQEKENKTKKKKKKKICCASALLLIITAAMPSAALTQLYRNKRAYVMIYHVVGRVVIIELLVAKNAGSGGGGKRITNRHVAVAHAFKLPTTTTLIESSSSPKQVR